MVKSIKNKKDQLNQKQKQVIPVRQSKYWSSQNTKDKTTCVAGIKDYDQKEQFFWDILKELEFSKNKKRKDKYLLDICCGNGRCIPKYIEYFNKIGLTDNSQAFIEASKRVCLQKEKIPVFICKTDLQNLIFPSNVKWDLVLCNFALLNLNHKDLKKFIKKCYHALNIGGSIAIKETFARRTINKNGDYLDQFGGVIYRSATVIKGLFDKKWRHIITRTQNEQTAIIYKKVR